MHAGRAGAIFWLTIIAAGAVGSCVANSFTHYAPDNEWGGATGAFVLAVIVSAVVGAFAAVFHGAGILALRRIRPETVAADRAVSNVLSAVLVFAISVFGIWSLKAEQLDAMWPWPMLAVGSMLPFVITLFVVPAVSRFYRERGGEADMKPSP